MTVRVQYTIQGNSAGDIAASVESGVRAGRLVAGSPLPTVRALAASLSLSPGTVAAAYAALRVRGLVSTSGRRGTCVSPRPPLAHVALPAAAPHLRDLSAGNPDPLLLPRWDRAVGDVGRHSPGYGGPPEHPQLVTLGRRWFNADGIPAEHLAIVSGALDGVERVLAAHLHPGDRVAVEDPGYVKVIDLVAAMGLLPEPMPLDDFGVTPEGLSNALRAGARACILTPRAQNPTGAAFDPQRVRELQRVLAAHPSVLVVEDDHANVIAGTPALTLASPARESWAVVRSVSKSLGPDLRVALLCGDALTVARVAGRQALGCGFVSHVLQGAVATLLADKAVQRELRAAADAYTQRRAAMIAALKEYGVAAHGRSGLNVWLPVREEASTVASLAAAGWAVRAGERYRLKSPPAVRVTVATLRAGEAEPFARDLAAALRPTGRGFTT